MGQKKIFMNFDVVDLGLAQPLAVSRVVQNSGTLNPARQARFEPF
jgi:hypothetical protein